MAPFSKGGKDKQRKGAADPAKEVETPPAPGLDTPSRINLDRQELARITEQKIDEIESAIKQDYLKSAKAAREAAALERPSPAGSPARYAKANTLEEDTLLYDTVSLQTPEEDFQPTLVRADFKYPLLNDESE